MSKIILVKRMTITTILGKKCKQEAKREPQTISSVLRGKGKESKNRRQHCHSFY